MSTCEIAKRRQRSPRDGSQWQSERVGGAALLAALLAAPAGVPASAPVVTASESECLGRGDAGEPAALDEAVRTRVGALQRRAAEERSAAAFGELGLLLHAYDQLARAAACFESAGRLEPGAFRWTYYLGVAEAQAGRADRAIAALRSALRVDPGNVPARLRLAELLLAEGELDESESVFASVLRDRPRSAAAHFGLGRTFAERRKHERARESFERAVELSPRFGAAHYALAMTYRALNQPDQVDRHLAAYQTDRQQGPPAEDPLMEAVEALRIGPLHHLTRGRVRQAEGRHREAVEAYERALELAPSLVQAHVNLIAAYAATGAYEKAHAHYRAAAALEPHLPELHYNAGVLLMAEGRASDAAAAFRQALESSPLHADAHNNLGYLLAEGGRSEEAIGHFRAALETVPGHRDAHFNLARALQATGRAADAIDHFRRAAAVEDDKTPAYLYHLADAYRRIGALQDATQSARAARERAAAVGQTELVQRLEREFGISSPEHPK